MLCDQCYKEDATVFLTQVIDGETTQRHLCESCATQVFAQMRPGQWTSYPPVPPIPGELLERPVDSPTEVVLPDLIAVRELAAVLRVKPSQIIAVFMHYDIQKAANDNLDFAAASWVCHCFGVKPLKEQ